MQVQAGLESLIEVLNRIDNTSSVKVMIAVAEATKAVAKALEMEALYKREVLLQNTKVISAESIKPFGYGDHYPEIKEETDPMFHTTTD